MKPADLEVFFTPAEFVAFKPASLAGSVCVVFDVLRATSSMTVALANGATRIFPVAKIPEAIALRQKHPNALLAGERDGTRILAAQSGGVDFDLGNSPREFTAERVKDREIVITTTNGTRALQACMGADHILAGAILNLAALAQWLEKKSPARVMVVCAGTYEEAAYEDTWAAGAVCDLVWKQFQDREIADSAQIAREIFLLSKSNPAAAWERSRNARRLLASPDLRDDVAFCWRRDAYSVIGESRDGVITRSSF